MIVDNRFLKVYSYKGDTSSCLKQSSLFISIKISVISKSQIRLNYWRKELTRTTRNFPLGINPFGIFPGQTM